MQPFTKNVIAVLKNIPSGKVMTYSQVAACAGSPRGARQVVRILHTMSEKYNLPWHRIVNIKGEITFKNAAHQKALLESEGIIISDSLTLNIEHYQYKIGPMDFDF
ncbi:DNA methyltransferase [Lysinibacillus mangiferihumi]|uniref:DNA methyltransferase n=1 Tax=Lysinibacillus mangiferihumi TaxID=1130819 RepID=A0A4U2Y1R4_9BACI|nr:MGMT family protein [Lysinibacillus mangiferihumi]TKI53825.1 DNA methyltransferase [Lysinibacillus mangiferihumi]